MLIGVGIGPGDPELLTVKAVKLLETAEAVFVPGEVARTVIAPYRSDAIGLTFPMTDDHAYIEECMQKNADRIAPVAREGLAVFAILGDPNFFGTFGRLKEIMMQRYPDIECSTVPGISAITAFASRSNVTISGGFSVSDGIPESARILLKVKSLKN